MNAHEPALPPVTLLEPEQLLPRLEQNDDLLLLDVCNPNTYRQLHLPGAVHINPAELVSGIPPVTGLLPTLGQLQALMQRISYHPDKTIVVYDDEGGGWAGRLLWTLDLIGHRKLAYLNGGLHAWLNDNLPIQTTPVEPVPSTCTIAITRPKVRIRLDELLNDREQAKPCYTLWDARSADEFYGLRHTATRAGHIPGAIHFEWTAAMDPSRGYRLRQNIATLLSQQGLGADQNIVTYCQSHHRSGFTYLVARILGYPHIRAYDGSWSEWGNLPDTPIER